MLLHVHVDEETYARLTKYAREHDRTIPDLIECAVAESARGLERIPSFGEEGAEPILVIDPDSFAACPICQKRLETDPDKPVGSDADGPIYEGVCVDHGKYQFQVQEDDDGEG